LRALTLSGQLRRFVHAHAFDPGNRDRHRRRPSRWWLLHAARLPALAAGLQRRWFVLVVELLFVQLVFLVQLFLELELQLLVQPVLVVADLLLVIPSARGVSGTVTLFGNPSGDVHAQNRG
jgi:hypothetical protein